MQQDIHKARPRTYSGDLPYKRQVYVGRYQTPQTAQSPPPKPEPPVKPPKKHGLLTRYFYKTPLFIRVIIGIVLLLLMAELVLPIYDAQKTASKYDLSKVEGVILSKPVDQYAEKINFQKETGSYVYNADYSPAVSEVAGGTPGPKISAEFKPGDEGVSVYDPENEVSLTFKPKFEVKDPQKNRNRIVYPVADLNATKVYSLKAVGIKEDIILHEFQGDKVEFKYDLETSEGTEVKLESDGSLAVYGVSSALLGSVSTGTEKDAELLKKARENGAKKNLLFRIPTPVVLEANKKQSVAKSEYILKGKELTVRTVGLQNASYPLTIDPSIYVESAAQLMRGNNETNTDFDIDNELIQKSQTTGARIDSWEGNLDMDEGTWGNGVAAAGGYVYRSGGLTGQYTRPQIVDQQESSQNSNSGTFTMNMPTDRPAGDLYIAILCHDNSGNTVSTPPSGWTTVTATDMDELEAFYKIGTDAGGGNEAASYNWTGASEEWYGVIIRVADFNSSDIFSGTPGTANTSGVAQFPSVTPDSSSTLVIRAAGADNDIPSTKSWVPDNHTKIASGNSDSTNTAETGDCGMAAAAMDISPTSGVATGTTDINDSSLNGTYGALSFAINPQGTTIPPQVQDSLTSSKSSDTGTTFTMNMPATRPAGDLYIAILCIDENAGRTNTVSPPVGWTEYADVGEHAAYYKIGTDAGGGNEASSYNWTISAAEQAAGVIFRVTGFDSSSPVTPTPTTGDSGGSNSRPTFPAITPSNNNTLIVRSAGADDDSPSATGWVPTGHVKIASGNSGGASGDCGYVSSYMNPSTASGVSTGTVQLADNTINDQWGASSMAVNPEPATTTTSTRSSLSWAKFNSSTLAIESPNPGTGACSGWCTDNAYDMPAARRGHSMVAYNGYLYAMGGLNNVGTKSSSIYIAKLGANGEPQLWHPTDTNKDNWDYWYEGSTLSTANSYFGTVAYNNKMYIVGGQTTGSPNGTTTVEYANINPNGTLGTWSTTGMDVLPGGAGTHMLNVLAYNDTLYAIGGFEGAVTSSANLRATTYYTKLNSDGTMNDWQQTNSFTTARATFGGTFATIWGAYIYLAGGCSTVNGSGYCTAFASTTELASINADGTIDAWSEIDGLGNGRIGYSLVAWQGGLYRLGGCTEQSASTGDCIASLADVDYGVVNPAGEVSTVSISAASGSENCTGTIPYDCDLPPPGDDAGEAGNMLSMTTILNGFLYVIGGCIADTCDGNDAGTGDDFDVTGNTAYVVLGDNGELREPDICGGTAYGAWCVDSTNRINGTTGVAAAGVTTFNNRIYIIGGLDGASGTGVQTIYYNDTNKDGSLNGAWESTTFVTADLESSPGVAVELGYTYAYARANPSSAGSNPGNLFIIGGCGAMGTDASCGGTYTSNVWKCNITTTGAIGTSSCTQTGQLQIDVEGGGGNQGLGLHSGTVNANYIYLIGGYSASVPDRDTVYYAKFDNSNNIVAADGGSAWILDDSELSVGRRRGFSFGYNGHIYSTGGFDSTGTGIIPFIEWSKMSVSDGTISDFVTSSVTINQRWGLSMVVSNGYAYVIGGCDVGDSPTGCTSFERSVQTFQLFNNNSGTGANYTAFTDDTLNFGNNRRGGSSAILNGYLYIAGGCSTTAEPCTALSTVGWTALDPDNGAPGTWQGVSGTGGSNLNAARAWGELVAAGGSLYYVGGQSSGGSGTGQTNIYYTTSITSGTPTFSGSNASNGLPAARTKFGAAVWNDRIYVVGGATTHNGTPQSTVYVSPQLSSGGNITSAWSSTTAFNVARVNPAVTAYANNLYLFGGYDGTNYLSDSQFTQINSDGTVDSWTYTTSLPGPLSDADAFSENGYIYVVGGRSAATTCEPQVLTVPIIANTTIASGNNPTGIGEWYESNESYGSGRYGAAAAVHEGKLYLGTGGCANPIGPDENTGTITQTGYIITGTCACWTDDWIGSRMEYADASTATIIARPDASTLVVDVSKTIAVAQTYNISPERFWYTTLRSQPQVAIYSRMIDTDTDVFPNSWLLNGLDNSIGARWNVNYRSMHDLDTAVNPSEDCGTSATMSQMTGWGYEYPFGNTTLGDVNSYVPRNGASYSTNTITQSGTTVTGSSTVWTSDYTGGVLLYADGTRANIVSVNSTTSITVDVSKTISSGQSYTITGGDINCARYYFFKIYIDASKTFGYPEDVTRGPTITDVSLFFTADPSKRLRHGKTFTGGEQQPLDTPCRQTVDSDCPLP